MSSLNLSWDLFACLQVDVYSEYTYQIGGLVFSQLAKATKTLAIETQCRQITIENE